MSKHTDELIDDLQKTNISTDTARKLIDLVDRKFVKLNTLEDLLGLTSSSCSFLAQQGIFVRQSRDRYFFKQSVQAYVNHIRNIELEKEIQDDRDRLIKFKADLEEMKAGQLDGTLIKKSTVEDEAYKAAAKIRQYLENLPAKLASAIHHESNEQKIYAILNDYIKDGLLEMVDNLEVEFTESDPDES